MGKAFGGLSAVAPATASVLGKTQSAFRSQTQGTKRAVTKPVVHKPQVVKTPAPAPPRVEPATQTPNMPPVMKLGAIEYLKDRVGAGVPKTGGRPQRPGEDMDTRNPKPSNEPVVHTNVRPHDF